jgi:hypothetical protein
MEFMYETGCRAEEIKKLRTEWFKQFQRWRIMPAAGPIASPSVSLAPGEVW